MNDLKSRLPDIKELSNMASKLYHGVKHTVTEIISDYKEKRDIPEETVHTDPTTAQQASAAKSTRGKAKVDKDSAAE